jgi:hypothetical protein
MGGVDLERPVRRLQRYRVLCCFLTRGLEIDRQGFHFDSPFGTVGAGRPFRSMGESILDACRRPIETQAEKALQFRELARP